MKITKVFPYAINAEVVAEGIFSEEELERFANASILSLLSALTKSPKYIYEYDYKHIQVRLAEIFLGGCWEDLEKLMRGRPMEGHQSHNLKSVGSSPTPATSQPGADMEKLQQEIDILESKLQAIHNAAENIVSMLAEEDENRLKFIILESEEEREAE